MGFIKMMIPANNEILVMEWEYFRCNFVYLKIGKAKGIKIDSDTRERYTRMSMLLFANW